LRTYLERKVRERGWSGDSEPDPAAIAERFAKQGYVDDSAYALAKSRSLTGRGYGKRRLVQALRSAGVDENEGAAAIDHADEAAVSAALRFAQRRRFGPYAAHSPSEIKEREKALAAMIRAGHGFALANAIISMTPNDEPNIEQLIESIRLVVE